MNRKKVFIAIGVFWLALIGGFLGFNAFTSLAGHEVLLKTRPVDPRDIFRGDYVRLAYDISSLDVTAIPSNDQVFHSGDRIYVTLEKSGDYFVAARVSRERPTGGIYISGIVTEHASPQRLQVEYGIESYFVPEHKGMDLQRRLDQMAAVVAVDGSGHSVLKSLLLNGETVKF